MPALELRGLFPPLATPREDGRPDVGAFEGNLRAYLEWPVSGVLVGGSSGEAALLDARDLDRLVESARAIVPADRTLIVGVRGEATDAAIRRTLDAEARGADATLLLPPHFHPLPDAALVTHFRAVADAATRPLLVYHVPKFTGRELSLDVLEGCAAHPGIAGVKESTTEASRLERTCRLASPSFAVLCGHAPLLASALEHGACGAVLAMANVVPDLGLAVAAAVDAADAAKARRLQDALSELSARILGSHGLAGMKHAMELRGLRAGAPAAPLPELDRDGRDAVRAALDGAVSSGALAALDLGDARRRTGDAI